MLRLTFLSLLPFILLPTSPRAAEPATDQTSQEVVFGGASYYPPFYYQSESGEPEGFDIALFKAMGDLAEWEMSFRFDRWEAIQESLGSGLIDVVPMFLSEERQSRYLFSDPVFVESHFIWGNSNDESQGGLDTLDGYSVAAENGAYSLQELRRLGVNAKLVHTESEALALRYVAQGIVDFAIIPTNVALYTIRQEGLDVEAVSPPILPIPYAFAINPQRPDLVSVVNDALDVLRRSGEFSNIENTWLYDERGGAPSATLLWLLPLIAATTLLAITLFISRRRLSSAYVTIRTNIADLNRTKELASSLSSHPLSNLPRREYFQNTVDEKISELEENRKLAVALFEILDLDFIQQVAGYDEADNYIRFITSTVSGLDGESCHISPSQFAYLFYNIESAHEALFKAKKLINDISRDYNHSQTFIEPEIKGGIAIYPDCCDSGQELLRMANIALTHTKNRNQRVAVYEDLFEPYSRNLNLLKDLKRAIKKNDFDWVYQPQFNVRDQKFKSAEMLIRWRHPELGNIPPDHFITLAEQSGYIGGITRAAIRSAIQTLEHWRGEGIDCKLSVNVSANDLADTEAVETLLEQLGALGSSLTFEITETAIMRDVDTIIRNVELLKDYGVNLSLDDYGTGYSSLFYLKEFNFDEIKIDKRFVKNILSSPRDKMLTGASIKLGHDLGAIVVAEGVEDLESARLLVNYECDVLQGFGISRPLKHDELIQFLGNTAFRLE